jgi:hypothetical protein
MDQNKDYERDLASIRNIMEKSVKFISLSGLGGVMAGAYALIASFFAFKMVYGSSFSDSIGLSVSHPDMIVRVLILGGITLVLSIVTGWFLSRQKARRLGLAMWSAASKQLLFNLGIPLASGGLFVLVLLWHGYIGLVAPTTLLFYGLALTAASQNLFDEMRYLGYSEILLGILSAVFIGYGLLFWALGFGVLHMVYGVMMYRKYDP